MKAERVLETCLYVNDLDAAEQFYTDVLGLDADPGLHLELEALGCVCRGPRAAGHRGLHAGSSCNLRYRTPFAGHGGALAPNFGFGVGRG